MFSLRMLIILPSKAFQLLNKTTALNETVEKVRNSSQLIDRALSRDTFIIIDGSIYAPLQEI
jgi:tetrahydromethanopterin S-methyltransferase subunit F